MPEIRQSSGYEEDEAIENDVNILASMGGGTNNADGFGPYNLTIVSNNDSIERDYLRACQEE